MEKSLDILWEKVQAMQKALDLQAVEYERRLTALNGEAGRLRGMQETYLLKDTYEVNNQTQNEKFDRALGAMDQKFEAAIREVKKDIKDNSDWRTSQSGIDKGKTDIAKQLPWIISAVISIIALVFMYLMYKK